MRPGELYSLGDGGAVGLYTYEGDMVIVQDGDAWSVGEVCEPESTEWQPFEGSVVLL
jgi:hypothetical protein